MKINASSVYEKISIPLMDAINANSSLKEKLQSTVGLLNSIWMSHITRNLWLISGEEHLKNLDAPQGMIIASNHRSFFDLYACSALLIQRYPHLIQRLYCPVRSEFFYNSPLGILLNLSLSGGSMWPPIFRDDRGRRTNSMSLTRLASVLGRGACVGFHPEGTRSKANQDPYKLLPARTGLGLLLSVCHPDTVVLPYFTLGMSNDLGDIIRRNYHRAPEKRGESISLCFGAPIRVGDSLAGHSPAEATEYVMERIRELGQVDKAMRQTQRSTVERKK